MPNKDREIFCRFVIHCSPLVCVYRNSATGRLSLCSNYIAMSSAYGQCGLTKDQLVVRGNLDGLPIAKRCKRCLLGEALAQKLSSVSA